MNTRNSAKKVFAVALLFAFALTMNACASAPQHSGFLGNYAHLKDDKCGERYLQWWEKTGFDWTVFKKLMIDSVVVHYHPRAKQKVIDSETEQELIAYFRETVEDELGGEYPVVTAPGPDVLRIRAAITEVIPANPALNLVTTALLFVPLDMGGAAIEAEFIDSVTGEVLASMVDKKMGTPIDVRFYQGLSTMGYAKGAFDGWAKQLKTALKTNP